MGKNKNAKSNTNNKNLETTLVFILKSILYLSILSIFFGVMAIDNWQLLVLSRTAGITLSTFIIVGLMLISIYGKCDIGKRKSKPIIYSVTLATLMTDVITYVQLTVMNANAATNYKFRFDNIGLLLVAMLLQVVCIILFTYAGNYIYFIIYDPEKTCIVTSSQQSLDEVVYRISKYKKQYKICYVIDYKDPDVRTYILKSDTVFIYDVPVDIRTDIMSFCYQNMKNIYINPEMSDVVEFNSDHVVLDDMSMLAAGTSGLTMEQRFVKRTMDIVISLVGIIISAPIMCICAIAIKLEDGGKVFFKQNRATRDGKIFSVYKIRTMKEDVENYSSVEDDERVTKVGRILRKYRIDEFPQLINVLKSEMSIVGPRPEMLSNIFIYTEELPEFEYRLRVKAGLTGYAQIAGKYNTSPKDKLILDLMYIEDYSLLMDIKLIFQTLIVLLKKDSTEAFGCDKHKIEFISYSEDVDYNNQDYIQEVENNPKQ